MTQDLLAKAFKLAAKAHAGQVDKGGRSYMEHIAFVVANTAPDPNAKVVAALHDIIEDTDVSASQLLRMFPRYICDPVFILTKMPRQTRSSYISKISLDRLACLVKLADLSHNANLGRLTVVEEKDLERARMYEEEHAFLTAVARKKEWI